MTYKEKQKVLETPKNWAKVYYYPLYRTAIMGDEIYLYHVVTRVNAITSQLWLDWRNKKVDGTKKGFCELPNKVNWLVMTKSFKREDENRIRLMDVSSTHTGA